MDRATKKSIRGNILVLTPWSYNDALIQTYTLPYLRIIRQKLPSAFSVILVTNEQEKLALSAEDVLTVNREWKQQNMRLVAFPYKRFGWRKMLASANELRILYTIVKKEKIGVIHAFCTPAGSIGYLLAKLASKPLIIDSYEPHAEAMVENKSWKPNGLPFRILHTLEKWQTQYASSFIATSAGMLNYAKDRFGVQVQDFYVKPACVDLNKFKPNPPDPKRQAELGLQGKLVCVYAGKLGGIYLREEVFDFIKQCYLHWGDRFRFLMLTNATAEEVQKEINRVGLPQEIVIQRFVRHEEVPHYLALGSFALNPVKPVPTKRYCTSIKDGEYWAMGLPVVITKDISDDSDIIEQNGIGYKLNALTDDEYKNAIAAIEKLLNAGAFNLKGKIRAIAENYRSFRIAEDIYTKLYA